MVLPTPDTLEFWDPRVIFPLAFKVRPREGGPAVAFNLWEHQQLLAGAVMRCYAERKWLAFVKPRKLGSSTFFTGVLTQHASFRQGCQAAILAHEKGVAKELAGCAIRFHRNFPAEINPPRKTKGLKRSLEFPEIDSRLDIASVLQDEPLRGNTGIQAMVCTEISSWSATAGPEAWTSALSNVPKDTGFVVAESTPRFYGDQLQVLWEESDLPGSKWDKLFIPWVHVLEYAADPPKGWQVRDDVADYAQLHHITERQAYWMQTYGLQMCANRLDKFRAEYPINELDCWVLAGDAIFSPEPLMNRMRLLHDAGGTDGKEEFQRYRSPEPDHRHIIFCDPAGSWAERDLFGVEIFNLEECEQVAEYLGHSNAYIMAKKLADWGREHNMATIYVEANGVGEAVLSHLVKDHRYPKVFRRKNSDTTKFSGGKRIPGWYSSQKEKARAVSIAMELIDDGSVIINSQRLLRQLVSYRGQWDKLKRDVVGGHFDLASAFCGAMWAWRHEAGSRGYKKSNDVEAVRERNQRAWDEVLRRIKAGVGETHNTPWGEHI